MDYEIEEILPIVERLTEKYTSKESSSVPYEAARMLMEAVAYCINENLESSQYSVVSESAADAELLYQRGCEIVLLKASQAKEIFEEIAADFEDYGCRNYKDTVINGIPAFFIKYDAKFNPQDHILTLDYPLLAGWPRLSGVDMILTYLSGIRIEKRFLDYFERKRVIELLGKILPNYESLYLDNICYPVLLNGIGCMIAEKPIQELILNQGDVKAIQLYFQKDDIDKIEVKIRWFLSILMKEMPETAWYFGEVMKAFSVRIHNGISNESLDSVFIT